MDKRYVILSFFLVAVMGFTIRSGQSIETNFVEADDDITGYVVDVVEEEEHDCLDFVDDDGDGLCDKQAECEKHNGVGGCGNHEDVGAPGKCAGSGSQCGGCPKKLGNGGSCGCNNL